MSKFYLVTGGAGFIGSALVRRLLAEGERVRVLDDNSRGNAARLADVREHFEFIQGDVRDAAAVAEAVRGVDAVVHIAFVNGTEFFYTRPDFVLDVGVRGMLNVLDGCRQHAVGELIVASSSEVYQTPPRIPTDETAPLCIPDPLNPRFSYAAGKIISEVLSINFSRQHLDRLLIFRPHNVYGPAMGWEHVVPQFVLRMHALCQASSGPLRVPIQGDGRETRAFTYIDDFIEGLMCVLRRGTHMQIYHIGTTQEVTVVELAREIGSCFGRDVELIAGPRPAGSVLRRCPDIARLRGLGYEPRFDLRAGLQPTVAWYVAHAAEAPESSDPLRKDVS